MARAQPASAADCGDTVRLRFEPSARTLGWELVPHEECKVGEADWQRLPEDLRYHMPLRNVLAASLQRNELVHMPDKFLPARRGVPVIDGPAQR
mgnify:CR=1 FL=1